MKILINKQTEEVIAGGEMEFRFQPDCIEIVESGAVSFRIFYVKPENAVVEDVVALPDGFVPRKFLYQDGEFVPNPAFQEPE